MIANQTARFDRQRRHYLGLIGSCLLAVGLYQSPLQAQSIVPAGDGTGTLVNQSGDRFDIQGGSLSSDGANLFHSFQRFGLDAGQIANFLAQPGIENVLSRVVGGAPSVINGLLQLSGGSPANLYLINPAGIVFGPNASLNVPGDFFATTATAIGFDSGLWFEAFGTNDYQQLVGTPSQFAFDGATAGAIANAGNLSVNPGRHLALIGGQVANTGQLRAPGGQITISAVPGSSRVRLSQPGHLLSLEIEPPRATDGSVLPIAPQDLPALLTGSGLDTGLAAGPDNTIQFSASNHQIGASPATAAIAGRLEVSNPNGTGGQIAVLGDRVALLEADLEASGLTGGGDIRIGGEYRGAGDLPNARYTGVSSGTQLRADALERGDGGRIILWADRTTRFFGDISARGGQLGGDGGFVEVSGKERLLFDGEIDAGAAAGLNGQILLDPNNIQLVSDAMSNPADNAEVSDQLVSAADPGGMFQISVDALASLTGDIALAANNNIQVREALQFPNYVKLTLEAGNNVRIEESVTFDNGASQLIVKAGNHIDVEADITGASLVDLEAGISVNILDTANLNAETLDFQADIGQVDVEGSLNASNIFLTSDNWIDIDDSGVLSGENIVLSGSNAIVFNNGSMIDSGNITLRTDNIGIQNSNSFVNNGSLRLEPLTPISGSDIVAVRNHFGIPELQFDNLVGGFDFVSAGSLVLKSPPAPAPVSPFLPPTPPPAASPGSSPGASPSQPGLQLPPTAIESGAIAESRPSLAAQSGDRAAVSDARAAVEQALDSGNPGAALRALDNYFSRAFAKRFGGDRAEISVLEFQRRLHDLAAETGTNPAVIFAFRRREQLELVLLTPTGAPMQYAVPNTPIAEVDARVRELQRTVVDPTLRLTENYLPAAQQLDAWLLQPLQADLARHGIDTLLFSLDEGLRSLPLAALHDGEQFLIERYRFSVIPSLSLANLSYTDVRQANILALGISEFQNLSPLPAVPTELATIAQQASNRRVLLNQGFTLANLKQQRQESQAAVLHLATHAEFVPGERGAIAFWERSLDLAQFAQIDWQDPKLALLVLSACRTALGDLEAEYGFAGLALQSGVETALASLWYASDVGTLGLMSEFYAALRETPLKSEALRQAQLAMLRGELRLRDGQLETDFGPVPLPESLGGLSDRSFQHPYYWSSFTTVGNPW